jgi:glutamate/aspartate transport system permease protein
MSSYQWNWQIFMQDTGAGETYLHWMISAWGWTLSVAGLGWLVALVFGSLIGVLRTVPNKGLQMLGNAWVELFRNIPVLVQVFLWYHVLPALVPPMKSLSGFVLVVFALGFFTSARVAEQVRAGILSLPRGQRMAGLAMGLTLPQTYRHVILPMAYRIVLPPLTSEAMNIVKNSSVAFAVSIPEMIQFAMQAQEETSRGIEIYLGVTSLYIVSALLVNRVMALIERQLRVPGYVGGGK